MASWIYFSVCIVATIVLRQVSGTSLTITPNQVQIGGTNPTWLNGTCRPPSGTTSVFALTVGRRRISSGTISVMVQIQIGEEVKMPGGNFGSRLTAQGDIQSGSSSSSSTLRFGLSNPTCGDINDYTFYCTANFLPNDPDNTQDFKNISYTANPADFKMIVFPDYTTFEPPAVITFTCTALIGSNFPTDQSQFWKWEWRSVANNMATNWQPYPYTSNITYGDPDPSGCNYNGRSEMKHTVREQDDYQQIRCYIVNSNLYSGNKTIRITGDSTTGGTGQVGDDDTAGASVGLIVGVVLGVLAAIVIVVVLVYFLVFRRKSGGGDDYDTGEGKDERPEMTDNVVYSTPTSKQPHRGKGRENDALDEPHEKNPRPYYANNFGDRDHDRERGRANPAMDNDSRHDRSFDDDNTDSRMRSPYGSAV